MAENFDEQDREQVILWIEQNFDTKLRPVERRRKFFDDSHGKRYWVFGGMGYWHGIPSKILNLEKEKCGVATFFIAVRKKSKIQIFSGSAKILVSGQEHLSKEKLQDYKFNVIEKPGRLIIKERG